MCYFNDRKRDLLFSVVDKDKLVGVVTRKYCRAIAKEKPNTKPVPDIFLRGKIVWYVYILQCKNNSLYTE